ncbi:E3 ubiquitin-protein ligase RBBP6-like [Diadema antillarum]|uniref:E3 ubiquitin-protein ligase RBBP6-like n=1 Tax=Diadema antillarum TaxID=105358 RepID=UPI003A88F972
MSSVHYKFKSSIDYDTVTFDGLHISLADLKKAIMEQKKIGRAEFDLQVTNAQTSEEYKNEEDLIPRNASVQVKRVPIGGMRPNLVAAPTKMEDGSSKAVRNQTWWYHSLFLIHEKELQVLNVYHSVR